MSRQNTKVSHGVPQGSVLELILFPLYSHGQRFIHTHGHKSEGNFRLFVIFLTVLFGWKYCISLHTLLISLKTRIGSTSLDTFWIFFLHPHRAKTKYTNTPH